MPGADSTLRQIAKWRHIITTDLPSAFYQIPPVRESMKYCGIATPFHGVCMPCQRWACLALMYGETLLCIFSLFLAVLPFSLVQNSAIGQFICKNAKNVCVSVCKIRLFP